MLALVLPLLIAASPSDPLPEGNTFVRTLVDKQKRRERLLNDYTYDLEQLVEELDGNGAVVGRRVHHFEVFFVKGRRVFKLVGKDGRPLGEARQEAEERRVQEEVERATKDRSVLQDKAVELSTILERYDFRTLRREDLDGFPTLVFEFEARPGEREIEGDRFLRVFKGRIWVDEEEGELVRAVIENVRPIGLAGGLAASFSAVQLTIDYHRVADGLWLPARVESLVEGRLLLIKAVRVRSTAVYSRYRRFGADTEERIISPP